MPSPKYHDAMNTRKASDWTRGFIVHPTYRIESGRPVICLHGRLETGESFLVRDTRRRPHFYVRLVDVGEARNLGARPLDPTPKTTLAGEPVARVDVAKPSDTPAIRDRLIAAGIECYEADVRFAMGYLMDLGIRGSMRIEGKYRNADGIDRVYEDPDLLPDRYTPSLRVLSFDIETARDGSLLAISYHGCDAQGVLLLTPEGATCPGGAEPFATEGTLLRAFIEKVRELDPDVITGWNVIDFDLDMLQQCAKRTRQRLALGRDGSELRFVEPRSSREMRRATIAGRVVLDGIALLRGAFVKFDDYSLDAVANEVLGEGKIVAGRGRGTEIWRMFREDRERFVEYSLTDARLVTEILEKLQLIELAVERSLLTGLPPDRVSASVAAFDFLYLSELHRRGVVAPTVRRGDESGEANAGGHVLEPKPGLYDNVMVFDFKSLYPSIVRTFQIDPLGFLADGALPPAIEHNRDNEAEQVAEREPLDPIVAPNGAAFRRETGILTGMLDELFPRRDEAKAQGNWIRSHAIKILMNSFYGVLGTTASRFHSGPLANAITSFGREILRWAKSRIEAHGHSVLYGDTDSLFVASGVMDSRISKQMGEDLGARLNRELDEHVQRTWGVENRLELEFEKLYLKLLLPTVRHGATGARKRYAGLVEHDDGKTEVVFTGLEVVRRDWTDLAKRVQRELYDRLFRERPIGELLREVIADLRAGKLDKELVYRKGLRKDPSEYTRSTPPHVAAARKMSEAPGRVVAYVMTTEGAEPAGEREHPFDYEHYIQKQVRPVADPVLQQLGLEFELVAGLDRQLRLF